MGNRPDSGLRHPRDKPAMPDAARNSAPTGHPLQATLWFDEIRRGDVARVGGKNASLGEMVQALAADGIRVPPGFATTAEAYRDFVAFNRLQERIACLPR